MLLVGPTVEFQELYPCRGVCLGGLQGVQSLQEAVKGLLQNSQPWQYGGL